MVTDPNVHTGIKSVNLRSKIWSFLIELMKTPKNYVKIEKKTLRNRSAPSLRSTPLIFWEIARLLRSAPRIFSEFTPYSAPLPKK